MAIDCIAEIPGAAELSNWFGGFPSFHDAYFGFQINSDGSGWLRAYGARMTDRVDAQGYFISEKHFAATLQLEEIQSVQMSDFLPGLAILGRLEIRKAGADFEVDFGDTSYGVSGVIRAKRVSLKFEPDVRVPE
jgi:hypothetical protein